MKIIVMSDSHGAYAAVKKILDRHQEDADLFIHLGDGERDVHLAMQTRGWLAEKLCYVKGNCDYGSVIPDEKQAALLDLPYGHRIFAVHGDRHMAKYGTQMLLESGAHNGADIVLYGHTHVRECRYENGIYLINPGSLGIPRDGMAPGYATVSISEKGVLANLVKL